MYQNLYEHHPKCKNMKLVFQGSQKRMSGFPYLKNKAFILRHFSLILIYNSLILGNNFWSNKLVKQHNGPSAILDLIAIGYPVVDDATGCYGFGITNHPFCWCKQKLTSKCHFLAIRILVNFWNLGSKIAHFVAKN